MDDVPITASNYAETWKEIQLRFHNSQAVVSVLYDGYKNIKPVAADTDSEVHRLIYDLVSFRKGLAKLLLPLERIDYFLVKKASRMMHAYTYQRWAD